MTPQFGTQLVNILLVEDNAGDAILTEEALVDSKIKVALHHVRDGLEALAFLRREGKYADTLSPDLILLDLNMPRMDGRELLKLIKEDPNTRRIPVVVLTTSEAEKDILRSYDLQASCYVTKPVDFQQFQAIVNQLKEFWFTVVRLPDSKSVNDMDT